MMTVRESSLEEMIWKLVYEQCIDLAGWSVGRGTQERQREDCVWKPWGK